ncbi:hypothetical protein BPAE_0913g00020 [Botrytis paeoniae]|uniref:Uncharacterized protein n=1 Tax=Botrytis paeoniae TaxID=278948 RepID=A0A4Z1EH14_9HELO|nr:hypothetical protein BPAE_0913g00020 [Botrytis paeoniae]
MNNLFQKLFVIKSQKETSNRNRDYYTSWDIIQIAKESIALIEEKIEVEITNLQNKIDLKIKQLNN